MMGPREPDKRFRNDMIFLGIVVCLMLLALTFYSG